MFPFASLGPSCLPNFWRFDLNHSPVLRSSRLFRGIHQKMNSLPEHLDLPFTTYRNVGKCRHCWEPVFFIGTNRRMRIASLSSMELPEPADLSAAPLIPNVAVVSAPAGCKVCFDSKLRTAIHSSSDRTLTSEQPSFASASTCV